MEGKRSAVKSDPFMKSRSVTSLKSKGDSTSKELGKTLLSKNSPAALRSSSNSLHSAAVKAAAGKSTRPKSQVNMNEVGEPSSEEAKLHALDNAFQSHISAVAMKALLGKSGIKSRGDIDKQISTLQKRVNDNLDALEETRSKLNVACLLQEPNDILAHLNDVCVAYSDEPTFTRGKSFEELLKEINRISNQLPCKNVCVPETNTELAHFQDATSKLLQSLELISTSYGSDQTPITLTTEEIKKIETLKSLAETSKDSTDTVSRKASISVLNEALVKSAQLKF